MTCAYVIKNGTIAIILRGTLKQIKNRFFFLLVFLLMNCMVQNMTYGSILDGNLVCALRLVECKFAICSFITHRCICDASRQCSLVALHIGACTNHHTHLSRNRNVRNGKTCHVFYCVCVCMCHLLHFKKK